MSDNPLTMLLLLLSIPTLQTVVEPWMWMGVEVVMVGQWLMAVLELMLLLLW